MAKRRKRAPGAGRPPSENPRDRLLKVRVTEDELNAYALRAAERGLTVSEYIRDLLRRDR